MADDQKTQAQPGSSPDRGAQNHANGHDGSKYASKEEPKDSGHDGDDKKPINPVRQMITIGIVAAVLIVGLICGLRIYHYGQNHEGTDDAYVTGNLVNVSPIISGTLTQLTVDEGFTVKQGDLIGRLEDSGPRAAVQQAKAAYQAALSQIPQAEQNLIYQQQATDAAVRKAQAELSAQQAKTSGAQQQVTLSRDTVLNQVNQARSQVAQAQAQAAQADAQVQAAQAVVNSQRQAVQTAQRGADAATAAINGAQANTTKSKRDEARYAALVQQEAITPQQYDAAKASAESAQSQLDTVRFQAAQAYSQVNQARANVAQALSQLQAARKTADAVHQQVEVARAGLGIAQANLTQVGISQTNVLNNLGQNTSAQADLSTAQAGRTQIKLREDQIRTFQAQADQAKAALDNAVVQENDTYIKAPTSGTIVRKAVNIGASLSPGQSIVTMTQGNYVYVTANFKETQLRYVKPGEDAEVDVDAFPGRIFKGRVASISRATGATESLLPPDNATGNFTKVVQRIPVRIELVAAADNDDQKYARAADIQNLPQGESVTATIDVSSARR